MKALPFQRSVDAKPQAQGQRQRCGDDGKLDGGGQALAQQRRDGPALTVGDAEVTLHRIRHEAAELQDEGVVEAERVGELLPVLQRRVLADDARHGVAHVAEHREGDEGNGQHDHGRLQNAANEISEHPVSSSAGPEESKTGGREGCEWRGSSRREQLDLAQMHLKLGASGLFGGAPGSAACGS